jgi:HlyD family secretion protein
MVQNEGQPFEEPFGQPSPGLRQLPTALWIVLAAVAGGVTVYAVTQMRSTSEAAASAPTVVASIPTARSVAALGRLEPQGEVTRLSAPASLEGNRASQVLVREGEAVAAGQIVAVLDTHDRRLAALEKAKTDAQTAAARLERVKSTQGSDVAAQKAAVGRAESEERGVMAQAETIARLEVQREDARTQYDRFLKLSRDGAISASDLDEKRLAMATLEAQLKEAQATLVRLQESAAAQVQEANANLDRTQAANPTDVQVAAAELASANAAVTQAQADLEVTYIRSPISATVLKVHVRPGEVIGQKGIAELGQTDQMNVVAQVYKTDINKVRVGQGAIVTSEAFPGELRGTVSQVGLQVSRQDIFDTNPLARTDNNIVEVRIRLDAEESKKVAGLSNLQVQAVIQI